MQLISSSTLNAASPSPDSSPALETDLSEVTTSKQKLNLIQEVTAYLGLGGDEDIERDIPKAISLLETASSYDNWAKFKLADLHLTEIHPYADVNKAVAILEEGVENNCDLCTCRLGELYLEGVTIPMNLIRAEALFRKSTALKSQVGPVQLARVLTHQAQKEPNYIHAYIALINLAKETGDSRARRELRHLQEEIVSYQNLRNGWKKTILHLMYDALIKDGTLQNSPIDGDALATRSIGDILLGTYGDVENAWQWIKDAYQVDEREARAHWQRINPRPLELSDKKSSA